MICCRSITLGVLLLSGAAVCEEAVITDIATLRKLKGDAATCHGRFALTGQIAYKRTSHDFIVNDGTGYLPIYFKDGYAQLNPGDVVDIRKGVFWGCRYFAALEFSISDRRTLPPPKQTTISEISDPKLAFVPASLCGRIHEIFPDELDPGFVYLTLIPDTSVERTTTLLCITTSSGPVDLPREESIIRVTGIYCPYTPNARPHIGPSFAFKRRDLEVVSTPDDFTSVDEVKYEEREPPAAVLSLGKRKIAGTVLATWGSNQLLLRSKDGKVHRVELSHGQRLPSCNDKVVIVGNTETDLYHVNFSHAICRTIGRDVTSDAPESLTPETILCNERGERMIKPQFSGKLIRICGKVTLPQSVVFDRHHIYLNCGQHIVPVDISSLGDNIQNVPLDATVEATGICFMDVDNWRPNSAFPRIRGFTVIARSPDDIRIVSKPPWWTPVKFLSVIIVLIAALVVIVIWNRSLKFLVNRRSRQLLREQISYASAVLKAEERTRLAIELHDSLSQNLAGVACQINTMEYAFHEDPPSAAGYLTAAKRMLQSCQTELKRCLFDLRCNALDNDSLEDAIRTTLAPVIGSVQLVLRFTVQRQHLLETTAHTVICIVRELASNAVRHGHASELRIAGALTEDQLEFSVRDNGTGFDTDKAPGPDEGHFGLQGIRDRVNRLHGNLSVKSTAAGTYVRVSIQLSKTLQKHHDENDHSHRR